MASFTAKDVAELRRQTGCGMMDCKNALVEANGDFEAAVKILREKGMAASAKKQSRVAAEGLVDILTLDGKTAMIEVNTETDFVAKNESFKEFVKDLLQTIIACSPANVEALMGCAYVGSDKTVEAVLQEKTYTIGEKLSIRRFILVEGVTSTYVHGTGVTGVVISFDTDVADHPEFAEFGKNIALQAAAYNAPYLSRDTVPASVIEEEKAILLKQMEQDPKMANKPAKVLEGIVAGKLGKFFEANCLLEQAYVKDDSLTVGKYVEQSAKAMGGSIVVTGCYRYDKGEGIEKREDDLAAEVAKMVGGN
ncbi:MAG: elongation factor Ts [Clostridia bacterium]|nr:elongation factor Ts [Clostridia bacterium]